MSIGDLYKYGRLNKDSIELLERSETLFSTPQIWLSRPSELNDPFECRPRINYDGTSEQIIEAYKGIHKRKFPFMPQDEVTASATYMYLQGGHKDPHILNKLRTENLQMYEEFGLYCLSKEKDSILMWSHYADNHKGYCLEFEVTDSLPFFCEALEVKYCKSYPIIEFFETSIEQRVDLAFLTKYIGWEYEHEWRIIDPKGPGWREYPCKLLKGVIFGVKMSDDDKAKIREWVGRRGHVVQFYQAVQHDQRYSIEVQTIL